MFLQEKSSDFEYSQNSTLKTKGYLFEYYTPMILRNAYTSSTLNDNQAELDLNQLCNKDYHLYNKVDPD